jgi:hypothetical protein
VTRAASFPRVPLRLLILTLVVIAANVSLSLGQEPLFDTVLYGLRDLTFGITGALVIRSQPANPIGWLLSATGLWGALRELWEASAYNGFPTGEFGQWVVSWCWIGDLAVYAFIFLLFPTGRLMSRRWRRVAWLLAAGAALAIPGQALSPDNTMFVDHTNPFAVHSSLVAPAFSIGITVMLVALLASVASLILRFRRSAGVERLQLKQLVLAASVCLVIMPISVPFFEDSVFVQVVIVLALISLPVATGMAILRYRLYDIDVVINRTLVYAGLTATLAGTYLASVLLLQLVLSGVTPNSSLAVAGSTLAVAALFQPARRRIQSAVDRRFFRRKYDAVRTLERFGARLRDEIDLDALGVELRAVVGDTMQPAHVSLWIRPR